MANWRIGGRSDRSTPDDREWSLSIWPVEGERYGVDAHYYGDTGAQRATVQVRRLEGVGITATMQRDTNGALIRLGPIAQAGIWIALEAFLGEPSPDGPLAPRAA
jgi:hypothetical protein